MRISGFASGFDTNQIVKDLMAAHRKPLDRIVQQKQIVEWQREEYRKINSMMLDFRNNKLTQFRNLNQINAKTAAVTGDTSAVSARATQSAINGTMTVSVSKLATSTTMVSSNRVGDEDKPIEQDKVLSDLFENYNFGNKIILKNTENDIKATIEFDPSVDTVNSLVQKINANKDAGVIAFFDHDSGKMSLTSKETGAASTITIGNEEGFEQNILIDGFNLELQNQGEDAELKVNGIDITRSTNTFTINGVQLTLNHVTTDNSVSTINTGTDVDKIFETIASFVNEYNKLLDEVNSKLGEERFRSFHPLTPEQKKELTEDEVKLWEEKARSGMLSRDSILSNLVNELRLSIITNVGVGDTGEDDAGINITSLGITTGLWSERGKLVIDEDRLRTAIEEDPNNVLDVFAKQGSETGVDANKGIFYRMSDIIMGSINELSSKAGTSTFISSDNYALSESSTMGEEMRQLNLRMDDMNRRLAMLENRYYMQFTAMETAISRFNSQSSVFSNYM